MHISADTEVGAAVTEVLVMKYLGQYNDVQNTHLWNQSALLIAYGWNYCKKKPTVKCKHQAMVFSTKLTPNVHFADCYLQIYK